MIKHIVLLKWKEGVTQQDIDAVGSGFAALKDEIAEIVSYQFGPDAGIFKGNAHYALVAEFRCEADLKTYAAHPAHQAFLSDIAGPILDSFQAAQFTIN